ncbi:hypothetical protein BDFB_002202 [Asbolus verrucosus]|uniref:Uncharacterized protein n=1 Tax=Asbolus verrucosus TaxID=1661398 RepID=A0A482VN55_ASBVE|nr:hypothetical protein BDFB_002202 [Asbolus verrucosus]
MTDFENNLKERLVEEIKREKWKSQISEEEYATNSKIFEELQRKNLETITRKNREFYKKKLYNVSVEAQEAYDKWKRANHKNKKCPKVSVQNLLVLLHYLNSESSKRDKKQLDECLRRQKSTFEVFWDSPSCILKALRQCVLTRDWSNMTYFSLILLNYDKKYLQVVRNVSNTCIL